MFSKLVSHTRSASYPRIFSIVGISIFFGLLIAAWVWDYWVLLWFLAAPALLLIYAIPKWQTKSLPESSDLRFTRENEARKTLTEIFGAAGVVTSLFFTWQAARNTDAEAQRKLSNDVRIAYAQIASQQRLSSQQIAAQANLARGQNDFQQTNALEERRREVYVRLLGLSHERAQIYASEANAKVDLAYQLAIYKIATDQKLAEADVHMEEAREAERWDREMVLQITKVNVDLNETLAAVQRSFPSTPQLKVLIRQIYAFPTFTPKNPPNGADIAALDTWREQTLKEVISTSDALYKKPVEELADYLDDQMNSHR